jgi:hypothetical protein
MPRAGKTPHSRFRSQPDKASGTASTAVKRDIPGNPVQEFFRVQPASVEYRNQRTGGD